MLLEFKDIEKSFVQKQVLRSVSFLAEGSVDNTLMTVASYIPFTSPMAMFTRIAMSTVARYEIAASIAILVASTVGIGFLSARRSPSVLLFTVWILLGKQKNENPWNKNRILC